LDESILRNYRKNCVGNFLLKDKNVRSDNTGYPIPTRSRQAQLNKIIFNLKIMKIKKAVLNFKKPSFFSLCKNDIITTYLRFNY